MATKDPRIDAYIAKSADFAKPILNHLRALVHKGCPDVVETIKWGMPSLEYKGPFCGFAAFKQHCVFGFWKSALLFGGDESEGKTKGAQSRSASIEDARRKLNWGARGRDPVPARITSLDDLPSDAVILGLTKQAAKLNDDGIKLPAREKGKKKPVRVPKEFAAALKKTKKAAANFDAFSPSHKREYVEWIVEAKTDQTRERRIAAAIEWIAQGKSRPWKYQSK
ncbi:MAG: YdeI/OmpD-associated family protein [Phycisphaerales bacterium]|nr:YdeI/OmpD-associated family protein [Phycisphaerales bacterium]